MHCWSPKLSRISKRQKMSNKIYNVNVILSVMIFSCSCCCCCCRWCCCSLLRFTYSNERSRFGFFVVCVNYRWYQMTTNTQVRSENAIRSTRSLQLKKLDYFNKRLFAVQTVAWLGVLFSDCLPWFWPHFLSKVFASKYSFIYIQSIRNRKWSRVEMDINKMNWFLLELMSSSQSSNYSYSRNGAQLREIIVFSCICLSTISKWFFIISPNNLTLPLSLSLPLYPFLPSLCAKTKSIFSFTKKKRDTKIKTSR